MLLCCLIPLAAIGGLFLFQVEITPGIWFGIMLLCPVLHLVMMKFMMQGGSHEHHIHPPSLASKQVGSKVKE
jgi:hypothetical protein